MLTLTSMYIQVVIDTFLWCVCPCIPHAGFPSLVNSPPLLHARHTTIPCPHLADTSAVFTVMLYTYWRFQPNDQAWTRALVIAASVMGYLVTCEHAGRSRVSSDPLARSHRSLFFFGV